ncbi:uncharacterized protein PADG_11754 [Paracoccidioides brasiliensis Pb18]|uniref:Uncharacterized protein n=2 Tax=Paracoccidioides brasiliensis TaxID=121759 RepID=A0A0A0HW26_PARBD|nr:uncharacterized protein PADG_11754 [Paracoccidioides brasiliensis Pb18]KGM92216.1 hypothetical protein PADG_11754 [Paracoccidioides brasiliensis Pb18]ODH38561.1 hypothetical protein ACO22_02261 [Paracoccidioides brasiliensis]
MLGNLDLLQNSKQTNHQALLRNGLVTDLRKLHAGGHNVFNSGSHSGVRHKQASKQAAMFKTRVLAPHWSPMKYGSKSVIKYWIPPPLSGGRDTMPRAPDPQPWGLMAREEAEGCKSIINENGVL